MGVFSLVFLAGFIFPEVLQNPPRDLASLVRVESALAQLGVKTDEANLIALLQKVQTGGVDEAALQQAVADLAAEEFETRRQARDTLKSAGAAARPYLEKAAKSDDPEVRLAAGNLLRGLDARRARPGMDEAYLKRLFAIRMLEKMKSKNALPALRSVAEGNDITLAGAAREAIAVIQGEAFPAQETRKWIEALSARLPADTGFVALLRLDRNRRDAAFVELMQKMMKDKAIQTLMGSSGMPPDMTPMFDRAERGLIEAIGLAGNIRVDAVATISSNELTDGDEGYIAWVFRGFWDPARVRKAFASGMSKEATIAGRRVLYSGYSPALCVVDAKTAVFSMSDRKDASHIAPVLKALTAERGEHKTPAHVLPAFKLVLKDGRQLGAAGALSERQKRLMRAEFASALKRAEARAGAAQTPERKMKLAWLRLMMNLADANQFTADLDEKGTLTLTAEANEEKAAKVLHAALDQIQEGMREQMAGAQGRMPPMLNAIMPQGGKWLREVRTEGKRLVLKTDLSVLGKMALLFAGRASRPSAPVQARPQAVEEARRKAKEAKVRAMVEAVARKKAAEMRKQLEVEAQQRR